MADLARPMLAEVLACVEGLTDPAEAQERLVARGLLPEGWCDVAQRGWWCARCAKRCDRHTKTVPSTIPDLVAVTSLGLDAILRAEDHALEAPAKLREYGCPQPERVVWLVGTRGIEASEAWAWSWMKPEVCDARDVILQSDGWLCEYDDDGRWRGKKEIAAARSLWLAGLALDAITADAVRIVVPPVGGAR